MKTLLALLACFALSSPASSQETVQLSATLIATNDPADALGKGTFFLTGGHLVSYFPTQRVSF